MEHGAIPSFEYPGALTKEGRGFGGHTFRDLTHPSPISSRHRPRHSAPRGLLHGKVEQCAPAVGPATFAEQSPKVCPAVPGSPQGLSQGKLRKCAPAVAPGTSAPQSPKVCPGPGSPGFSPGFFLFRPGVFATGKRLPIKARRVIRNDAKTTPEVILTSRRRRAMYVPPAGKTGPARAGRETPPPGERSTPP